MSIKTQEFVVGGRSFKLTQLPAKRAQALFNRLCRIAMPAAARALKGAGGFNLKSLLNADLGGVADGVQMLFDKLDETQQADVLAQLFDGARIRLDAGKWADLAEVYDDEFAGRIDEVYLLAFEALKFNFASFSRALKAAFSAAKNEAATSE